MPGATSVYTSKAYRGFDKKLKVSGEMSEWLKEHAWKVCIRQKRIEGSNPSLSARHK